MGEVICITSGKGGAGKTTLCANLGAGLAMSGKKVLVIDMDLGLRNLDIALGLENRIVYNLIDVVTGKCKPEQAIVAAPFNSNLFLLASSQTKDVTAITDVQMKELVDQIKDQYDFILLDSPAGLGRGFMNTVLCTDRFLIVTTLENASVRDADKMIFVLENSGRRYIDLIINRYRADLVKSGALLSVDELKDVMVPDILGIIPYDEQIMISANKGNTVVDTGSAAAKAIMNTCKRLKGEKIPLTDFEPSAGIKHKFRHLFKRS